MTSSKFNTRLLRERERRQAKKERETKRDQNEMRSLKKRREARKEKHEKKPPPSLPNSNHASHDKIRMYQREKEREES